VGKTIQTDKINKNRGQSKQKGRKTRPTIASQQGEEHYNTPRKNHPQTKKETQDAAHTNTTDSILTAS
jgi:hypothetical protein